MVNSNPFKSFIPGRVSKFIEMRDEKEQMDGADEEPDGRVVGGDWAKQGQFKFIASLNFYDFKTDKWRFIGSAAIINKSWIITAAHCMGDYDKRYDSLMSVVVGTIYSNSDDDSKHGVAYMVSEVIPFDGWGRNGIKSIDDDFALLKLNDEIEFGSDIQPMLLPDKDDVFSPPFYAIGWGQRFPDKDTYFEKDDFWEEAKQRWDKHFFPDDHTYLRYVLFDHCNETYDTHYNPYKKKSLFISFNAFHLQHRTSKVHVT